MAFRLFTVIAIFVAHTFIYNVVGNSDGEDLIHKQYSIFDVMGKSPHTFEYYHPWGRSNDAFDGEMYADKRRYRPSSLNENNIIKRRMYGLWKNVPSRRIDQYRKLVTDYHLKHLV